MSGHVQNGKLKCLLVGIGGGYHYNIRLLHSIVKQKSDCDILFLQFSSNKQLIGSDLRVHFNKDINDFNKTFAFLTQWLQGRQYDLIGVSLMSHNWSLFVSLTRSIRESLPECKIIAGGVHPWHVATLETLKHCDYVCASEGEELLASLIGRLSAGIIDAPLRIPGLVEKFNNEVITTSAGASVEIEDMPVPTYGGDNIYYLHSVEDNPVLTNYDYMLDSGNIFVHIGRGCPYKCSYCINSVFTEKKMRMRTVDKLISEIKAILSVCRKVENIFFMDEIFPMRNNYLQEFVEKYRDNIGLPFQVTLYPGMLTEEKLVLLKHAGLKEITMGVQSGSESTIKNIFTRTYTKELIIKENEIVAKHKIMIYYDFIIRNPFETVKDYKETLELITRLKRQYYLKFYTLAFFPEHPITKKALEAGYIREADIDPSISYLDVTTPHKKAIAEHYYVEEGLVQWNRVILNNVKANSTEDAYYLIMSYYGYWFIPKRIVDYFQKQLIKGDLSKIVHFGAVINTILSIRNSIVIKRLRYLVNVMKKEGIINVFKVVYRKITTGV
ncbi:B12-binding domain-containing radical SAM protein [Candidatus Magnetominusculus xianensis]|uniref:B12-binding domain-containing radical SAM protein n=1 Tax=Candidatus Magnetominusculus xianensis TaxID=1748249 RepID=A0ABR5SCL0_9BACT|nr:B12-binding domain-containing radical SAM protein [Candidatus Magnetominusculus xianensis]